jgi:glutamine---fructose-6-phosphate transaminase (isomerizing)
MPVPQYDHGYKETANDSVVILLNSHGKDQRRLAAVQAGLRTQSNALVVELEESISEELSPLPLIVRLNLIMNSLADALHIANTDHLGSKVTKVDETAK